MTTAYRLGSFLAATLLTLSAHADPAPQPWADMTPDAWRTDLKYFADTAPQRHRDLYHALSQADFQVAVAKLDADIPRLSTEQTVVRFAQLAAMIQDAHSGINPAELMLPSAPVRFQQFDDGVYVVAADAAHADMVGGRLVSVGNTGWQDALAKAGTLVSDDAGNEGQKYTYAAHDCLNVPFLLHGLGLTDSSLKVSYTLEKGGKRKSYALEASVPGKPFSGKDLVFESMPEGWVSAYPSGAKLPLAARHPDQLYWYEPLPDKGAVYVSIRAMNDWPGQTLTDFAVGLGDYLRAHAIKRVVVDLRGNPGGNNSLATPLVVALIRSDADYRGGLWVLISHKTHSAAQNFVNRLETYTDAIFVGQPTGENPNMYGDPRRITLPKSGISVALSTLWWQDKDPRDRRPATAPEIAVPRTFADFAAGRDPALDIALAESAPKTLTDVIMEAAAGGNDSVDTAYKQFMADPRHLYIGNTEGRLNNAGYVLLGSGKAGQAVAVFQVNAQAHPQSANAWDSLGEGMEAAGDKAGAAAAYKRSLELDPSNGHAADALKRLAVSTPPS